MKDLDKFTSEIVEKVKVKKEKRKLTNIVISSLSACLLVFLILYSNIIPLNSFNFNRYIYENYLGVYANKEENTVFTFTNNSNAILTINSVPYSLSPLNNTKREFNFNATKLTTDNETNITLTSNSNETNTYNKLENLDKYLDETKINVVFYDGGATISGNIYGVNLSIDVKITKNSKLESGIWQHVSRYGVSIFPTNSYIIVKDSGEAYYIEGGHSCYEFVFVSVYNTEFCILLNSSNFPETIASLNRINDENGDVIIELDWYNNNLDWGDDSTPNNYFKLFDKNKAINYTGGKFTAKNVVAIKTVSSFGKSDYEMAKYLPIDWKLLPEEGHGKKLIDCTANLNLKEDGTVEYLANFGSKKESFKGEWLTTDRYIIVILEDYSSFGKVFTIYKERADYTFENYAESRIKVDYMFKTGYHDFYYYFVEMTYGVYWGDKFTSSVASIDLVYDKEYVLNGKYNKGYYDRTDYELVDFPENGKTKLVFHKDGTVDIKYENKTVTYKYTYTKYNISSTIKLEGRDAYLLVYKNSPEYLLVSSFTIKEGVLYAGSIHSSTGGIRYYYMTFDLLE